MITIVVAQRRRLLGTLITSPPAYVCLSELGKKILNDEFPKISQFFPMVEVWKTCIMPDHIHFILRIKESLPANKCLGHIIRGFKGSCTQAWRNLNVGDDVSNSLFEEGYNDSILKEDGQLEKWKRYLNDNPRRLALKIENPDLFKVWQNVTIGDWTCQMLGNIFLLDIPDISAVIVHRSDNDEIFRSKFRDWMECGERGGVLVSAAIADREKMVMREAINRGYRLIVLRENGFHKYYKPAGESFDACVKGNMLQICPWDYHNDRREITRNQCLELNALALHISHNR